jgi:hypothetical protein
VAGPFIIFHHALLQSVKFEASLPEKLGLSEETASRFKYWISTEFEGAPMRPIELSFALGLSTIFGCSAANAVTYRYISPPLNSSAGSTLDGRQIIFEFTTYNLLKPNLSFNIIGKSTPFASVPVIDWSLSVGQYQAKGIGNPAGGDLTVASDGHSFRAGQANGFYFLALGTNSVGVITDWSFELNPITSNTRNLISVTSGPLQTKYGSFVQVNPNTIGATLTDLARVSEPGTWSLVDSTVITPLLPLPESARCVAKNHCRPYEEGRP